MTFQIDRRMLEVTLLAMLATVCLCWGGSFIASHLSWNSSTNEVSEENVRLSEELGREKAKNQILREQLWANGITPVVGKTWFNFIFADNKQEETKPISSTTTINMIIGTHNVLVTEPITGDIYVGSTRNQTMTMASLPVTLTAQVNIDTPQEVQNDEVAEIKPEVGTRPNCWQDLEYTTCQLFDGSTIKCVEGTCYEEIAPDCLVAQLPIGRQMEVVITNTQGAYLKTIDVNGQDVRRYFIPGLKSRRIVGPGNGDLQKLQIGDEGVLGCTEKADGFYVLLY